MPLSANDLIKQNSKFITIQHAKNNHGYLVFSATQPNLPTVTLTELLIDDILQAAIEDKNSEWLKKICDVVDVNNPHECGGNSMLYLALSDRDLEEVVFFLHQKKAKLTLEEVIAFRKTHEITTRRSRRSPNTLVISTDIGTTRYEIARYTIQEILHKAIDEIDAGWIEHLIDNRYIPKSPTLLAHKCFWITLVSDVPREIKRIRATQKELVMSAGEKAYSSATFICPGIKTDLYGAGGKAGFLIELANRTVDYWYSGLSANGRRNEELTRDCSLAQLKQQAISQRDNQHFADIKENNLFTQMQRSIESHWASARKRSDCYSELKHLVKFHWNEGLIFYKSNEVRGIHYNPHNRHSIKEAVTLYKAFKENFNRELPFYFYEKGKVQKMEPPAAILQLKKTCPTIYRKNYSSGLFNSPRAFPILSRMNSNNSAASNPALSWQFILTTLLQILFSQNNAPRNVK